VDYEIIKLALELTDSSQLTALCYQVDFKGSVPRKDYPMMLVQKNGDIHGTIGGGKLEYDVIEKSKLAISNQQIFLEEFDLTGTTIQSDKGICGGSTTIIIEPISTNFIEFWKSINFENKEFTILTELSVDDTITIQRTIADFNQQEVKFPNDLNNIIINSKNTKRSFSFRTINKIYFFKHFIRKPMLHIFGAGHIGKAVSELSNFIGLNITIYDDRKILATKERFPFADDIIHQWHNLIFMQNDYILIASREHRHDYNIMQEVLKSKPGYIGLLSSKRKFDLISKRLRDDGIPDDIIKRIYSPVGIDIASETVPEIAISIISEIVRYQRKGI
jgi:xanthine dehydrogenase accessory factor